jgi:hypothetical protein
MHHISLSSNIFDIFKRYVVRVTAREPAILPEVSAVFLSFTTHSHLAPRLKEE